MDAIGIIGNGFVGRATAAVFDKTHRVYAYDIKTGWTLNKAARDSTVWIWKKDTTPEQHIEKLLRDADPLAVFVCVPSPQAADGSCDISTVDSVVQDIADAAAKLRLHTTVAIRSTVPPGTVAQWQERHREWLSLVHNPEFLREQHAEKDALQANRVVLGFAGSPAYQLIEAYREALPAAVVLTCDSTTAELVKYTTNAFLATKVSFANELYALCGKLGVDYKRMIDIAKFDLRLGESHWEVPGNDGSPWWGGTCFPKDTAAICHVARSLGVPLTVVEAARKANPRLGFLVKPTMAGDITGIRRVTPEEAKISELSWIEAARAALAKNPILRDGDQIP